MVFHSAVQSEERGERLVSAAYCSWHERTKCHSGGRVCDARRTNLREAVPIKHDLQPSGKSSSTLIR